MSRQSALQFAHQTYDPLLNTVVWDRPPKMGPQPHTGASETDPEWPFDDWGTIHDKEEAEKEFF